eukprot:CAMPEP_0175936050 /NCGR_PEP_ID=MMETSP0108-20121206/21404_1 /TAXON_ID=195067 ORGANISM="Goniomonas pacifica, Strain CCMP1869" /NCGR_SAMPLE_ID=MMETSP0108 /ASSEMBLY_ACC=CAM_ASM_000204 /LENGTH=204 /DNA_ID=CAMNT_0017260105 /DNA_START=5 /DNA_END=616 /DNA_ORIENTATION=-
MASATSDTEAAELLVQERTVRLLSKVDAPMLELVYSKFVEVGPGPGGPEVKAALEKDPKTVVPTALQGLPRKARDIVYNALPKESTYKPSKRQVEKLLKAYTLAVQFKTEAVQLSVDAAPTMSDDLPHDSLQPPVEVKLQQAEAARQVAEREAAELRRQLGTFLQAAGVPSQAGSASGVVPVVSPVPQPSLAGVPSDSVQSTLN